MTEAPSDLAAPMSVIGSSCRDHNHKLLRHAGLHADSEPGTAESTSKSNTPRWAGANRSLGILTSLLRCPEHGLVLANEGLQRLGRYAADRFDHVGHRVEFTVLAAHGRSREVFDQVTRHAVELG